MTVNAHSYSHHGVTLNLVKHCPRLTVTTSPAPTSMNLSKLISNLVFYAKRVRTLIYIYKFVWGWIGRVLSFV
jgi:hypothetical protein